MTSLNDVFQQRGGSSRDRFRECCEDKPDSKHNKYGTEELKLYIRKQKEIRRMRALQEFEERERELECKKRRLRELDSKCKQIAQSKKTLEKTSPTHLNNNLYSQHGHQIASSNHSRSSSKHGKTATTATCTNPKSILLNGHTHKRKHDSPPGGEKIPHSTTKMEREAANFIFKEFENIVKRECKNLLRSGNFPASNSSSSSVTKPVKLKKEHHHQYRPSKVDKNVGTSFTVYESPPPPSIRVPHGHPPPSKALESDSQHSGLSSSVIKPVASSRGCHSLVPNTHKYKGDFSIIPTSNSTTNSGCGHRTLLPETVKNEAASKIQAAYKSYKVRSILSEAKLRVRSSTKQVASSTSLVGHSGAGAGSRPVTATESSIYPSTESVTNAISGTTNKKKSTFFKPHEHPAGSLREGGESHKSRAIASNDNYQNYTNSASSLRVSKLPTKEPSPVIHIAKPPPPPCVPHFSSNLNRVHHRPEKPYDESASSSSSANNLSYKNPMLYVGHKPPGPVKPNSDDIPGYIPPPPSTYISPSAGHRAPDLSPRTLPCFRLKSVDEPFPKSTSQRDVPMDPVSQHTLSNVTSPLKLITSISKFQLPSALMQSGVPGSALGPGSKEALITSQIIKAALREQASRNHLTGAQTQTQPPMGLTNKKSSETLLPPVANTSSGSINNKQGSSVYSGKEMTNGEGSQKMFKSPQKLEAFVENQKLRNSAENMMGAGKFATLSNVLSGLEIQQQQRQQQQPHVASSMKDLPLPTFSTVLQEKLRLLRDEQELRRVEAMAAAAAASQSKSKSPTKRSLTAVSKATEQIKKKIIEAKQILEDYKMELLKSSSGSNMSHGDEPTYESDFDTESQAQPQSLYGHDSEILSSFGGAVVEEDHQDPSTSRRGIPRPDANQKVESDAHSLSAAEARVNLPGVTTTKTEENSELGKMDISFVSQSSSSISHRQVGSSREDLLLSSQQQSSSHKSQKDPSTSMKSSSHSKIPPQTPPVTRKPTVEFKTDKQIHEYSDAFGEYYINKDEDKSYAKDIEEGEESAETDSDGTEYEDIAATVSRASSNLPTEDIVYETDFDTDLQSASIMSKAPVATPTPTVSIPPPPPSVTIRKRDGSEKEVSSHEALSQETRPTSARHLANIIGSEKEERHGQELKPNFVLGPLALGKEKEEKDRNSGEISNDSNSISMRSSEINGRSEPKSTQISDKLKFPEISEQIPESDFSDLVKLSIEAFDQNQKWQDQKKETKSLGSFAPSKSQPKLSESQRISEHLPLSTSKAEDKQDTNVSISLASNVVTDAGYDLDFETDVESQSLTVSKPLDENQNPEDDDKEIISSVALELVDSEEKKESTIIEEDTGTHEAEQNEDSKLIVVESLPPSFVSEIEEETPKEGAGDDIAGKIVEEINSLSEASNVLIEEEIMEESQFSSIKPTPEILKTELPISITDLSHQEKVDRASPDSPKKRGSGPVLAEPANLTKDGEVIEDPSSLPPSMETVSSQISVALAHTESALGVSTKDSSVMTNLQIAEIDPVKILKTTGSQGEIAGVSLKVDGSTQSSQTGDAELLQQDPIKVRLRTDISTQSDTFLGQSSTDKLSLVELAPSKEQQAAIGVDEMSQSEISEDLPLSVSFSASASEKLQNQEKKDVQTSATETDQKLKQISQKDEEVLTEESPKRWDENFVETASVKSKSIVDIATEVKLILAEQEVSQKDEETSTIADECPSIDDSSKEIVVPMKGVETSTYTEEDLSPEPNRESEGTVLKSERAVSTDVPQSGEHETQKSESEAKPKRKKPFSKAPRHVKVSDSVDDDSQLEEFTKSMDPDILEKIESLIASEISKQMDPDAADQDTSDESSSQATQVEDSRFSSYVSNFHVEDVVYESDFDTDIPESEKSDKSNNKSANNSISNNSNSKHSSSLLEAAVKKEVELLMQDGSLRSLLDTTPPTIPARPPAGDEPTQHQEDQAKMEDIKVEADAMSRPNSPETSVDPRIKRVLNDKKTFDALVGRIISRMLKEVTVARNEAFKDSSPQKSVPSEIAESEEGSSVQGEVDGDAEWFEDELVSTPAPDDESLKREAAEIVAEQLRIENEIRALEALQAQVPATLMNLADVPDKPPPPYSPPSSDSYSSYSLRSFNVQTSTKELEELISAKVDHIWLVFKETGTIPPLDIPESSLHSSGDPFTTVFDVNSKDDIGGDNSVPAQRTLYNDNTAVTNSDNKDSNSNLGSNKENATSPTIVSTRAFYSLIHHLIHDTIKEVLLIEDSFDESHVETQKLMGPQAARDYVDRIRPGSLTLQAQKLRIPQSSVHLSQIVFARVKNLFPFTMLANHPPAPRKRLTKWTSRPRDLVDEVLAEELVDEDRDWTESWPEEILVLDRWAEKFSRKALEQVVLAYKTVFSS